MTVNVQPLYAPSNMGTSISNSYKKHKQEKKRAYEQRLLEVVYSTFTPSMFSATGVMHGEAVDNILQKTCLPAGGQMESNIQFYTLLGS